MGQSVGKEWFALYTEAIRATPASCESPAAGWVWETIDNDSEPAPSRPSPFGNVYKDGKLFYPVRASQPQSRPQPRPQSKPKNEEGFWSRLSRALGPTLESVGNSLEQIEADRKEEEADRQQRMKDLQRQQQLDRIERKLDQLEKGSYLKGTR